MTFVPTPPKSQARDSTFRAAPTRPCSFRHRRRVSLHLGHAPARRVRVPHTRVARVFASPSRATSSSAPSVTVIRAACATLRLCGALVSERARAGGAGIVCLAMLALFVDVAVGRKSRTSCVKVKTRQKATLDFDVCEPHLRAAALRAAARRDNLCNGRCAPVSQHRKIAIFCTLGASASQGLHSALYNGRGLTIKHDTSSGRAPSRSRIATTRPHRTRRST